MKLIIAGSRHFKDYQLLEQRVNYFLQNILKQHEIEIVSGGQVTSNKKGDKKWGADYLGEQYAKEYGYPVKVFPADWDQYGLAAGPIRNKEMAEYATHAIIFWNGSNFSKGTMSMIQEARNKNLILRIVKY